ncbi:MAG: TonB C-terminal domain-containing protein [Polyangiales bacterium]
MNWARAAVRVSVAMLAGAGCGATPSPSSRSPSSSVSSPPSPSPSSSSSSSAIAHRGEWEPRGSFARWRDAIENFTPAVQSWNTTALGPRRAAFASYLTSMHRRVHPIFVDGFLATLSSLPPTHALQDGKLTTTIELALRTDGSLHRMGVIRSSGVAMFDLAVLDAFDRASPFDTVPAELLSEDGLMYLHWDVHRDERSCSAIGARPFVLTRSAHP